jgi:hypothetical protein
VIHKLTTSTDSSEEPVWVNIDQILKITRLEPRPKMPSTGIDSSTVNAWRFLRARMRSPSSLITKNLDAQSRPAAIGGGLHPS